MDVLTTPPCSTAPRGALLLLAALGLTLTFGQMGVINMAHGEFLMVGAYVAYVTQQVISSQQRLDPGGAAAGLRRAGPARPAARGHDHPVDVPRPLDTLLVTVGVAWSRSSSRKDVFGAQGVPVEPPAGCAGSSTCSATSGRTARLFTIVLALGSALRASAGG